MRTSPSLRGGLSGCLSPRSSGYGGSNGCKFVIAMARRKKSSSSSSSIPQVPMPFAEKSYYFLNFWGMKKSFYFSLTAVRSNSSEDNIKCQAESAIPQIMEGNECTGLIGFGLRRMGTSFLSVENAVGVPKETVRYSEAFYELPQEEGREGGAA